MYEWETSGIIFYNLKSRKTSEFLAFIHISSTFAKNKSPEKFIEKKVKQTLSVNVHEILYIFRGKCRFLLDFFSSIDFYRFWLIWNLIGKTNSGFRDYQNVWQKKLTWLKIFCQAFLLFSWIVHFLICSMLCRIIK